MNQYQCASCNEFFNENEGIKGVYTFRCFSCEKEWNNPDLSFRITLKGWLSLELGHKKGERVYERLQEYAIKVTSNDKKATYPCVVFDGGGHFIGAVKNDLPTP